MGITTSTGYGRQSILWPDFAHEGGTALHGKIVASIGELSDNTTAVWSGEVTKADTETHDVAHNFGMALSELTVAIYVAGAFVQEGSSAAWTVTQVDTDTIRIQNNTGSSATFFAYVLGFNIKKVIGNASTTNDGLMTSAAQTIGGEKTFADGVKSDTIVEETLDAGVTIDGLQVKDGGLSGLEVSQLEQQSTAPATPANGKSKFYVKDDGVAYILNSDGIETPVGSGSTIERVSHTAHGFIVGTPLYDAGTNFAKGNCSDSLKAEVIAMVSRVIDVNTFEVITNGITSGGLVADCFKEGTLPADGAPCFLSDVDGKLTVTDPSTVGNISKPIFFVRSVDATHAFGYFQNMRGQTVGGTNLYTTISLNNGTSTTLQNLSAATFPNGSGGFIEGFIKIDATVDYVFTFKVEFSKDLAGTVYDITYTTGAGNVPPGFLISNSGANINVIWTSLTGFSSASATFSMQAAAIGAQLPLQISGANVTGPLLGGNGTAIPAGFVGEVKFSQGANGVTKVGASGDTVFDSTNAPVLTLGIGVWLITGATSMASAAAADAQWLSLHDTATGAFGGGTSHLQTAIGVWLGASCFGTLAVTSGTKTVYLRGNRNGGSTVNIGAPTGTLDTPSGFLQATRIG